ncbi:hypothetical protein ASG29_07450 [Sphingomonas sp. Leaf412]|uniref:MFS transporter n=1 Tax=Sphingomonas sp. Leaf412 TaxID=1736370 RepID=UPI0006F71A42|nr:MFS transporter [Sphingomonas sp. Leaf412]KQT31747.1 hypothetical protein ASG29_07450 [Sphingomonas sp. Leaf412]
MTSHPTHRSTGFLIAYALANTGGVIAYFPLLTLLLPMKVERIAGAARLDVLTICIVAGAVAASVSNVAFGWLSDRSVARGGGRRRWLVAGAASTLASYAAIAAAATPGMIVLGIVLFQVAVNTLLAPLSAMMADEVPDAQRGIASGLLALAVPVAAGVSASLVAGATPGEGMQFAIVGIAMLSCVVPVLAIPARAAPPAPVRVDRPVLRADLAIAWIARLLVQVAGSALSAYLLYYFAGILPDQPPATLAPRVGNLLTLAYAAPLPIAILLGRWSDRTGRRKPFLLGAAGCAAGGLALMARADGWTTGAAGFTLYAIGSATFLALHAGFAMQLLPSAAHRGRDLGLLNLANTLPSLAGPLLTWWLATPQDFGTVIALLSLLTLAGGVAMLGVRGRR